jgi:hypothetical protein
VAGDHHRRLDRALWPASNKAATDSPAAVRAMFRDDRWIVHEVKEWLIYLDASTRGHVAKGGGRA